jgi:transposase InsO family protein
MRKYQITARPLRRSVKTTDSTHPLPVAPNLLKQQFSVEKPNTHWSADITYLWTGEGWLYLAVVIDLYSRRVVGWSLQNTLDRSIVLDALKSALQLRHPEPGLICHRDRGSQYASNDYQQLLSEAVAVCSMSRKGNCYDNAPVESFFASMKRELIHQRSFSTHEEALSRVRVDRGLVQPKTSSFHPGLSQSRTVRATFSIPRTDATGCLTFCPLNRGRTNRRPTRSRPSSSNLFQK